jgi:hypothetical protein
MSDTDMAYISKMPCCGRVVMAAVDEPQYAKDNAKTVATAMRRGEIVERVTVAEVREMEWATGEHARGKVDCQGNSTKKGTIA